MEKAMFLVILSLTTLTNGDNCQVSCGNPGECPPGCYVEGKACVKCDHRYYNSECDTSPRCEKCDICTGLKITKEECTTSRNVTCQCKEGFVEDSHQNCVRQSISTKTTVSTKSNVLTTKEQPTTNFCPPLGDDCNCTNYNQSHKELVNCTPPVEPACNCSNTTTQHTDIATDWDLNKLGRVFLALFIVVTLVLCIGLSVYICVCRRKRRKSTGKSGNIEMKGKSGNTEMKDEHSAESDPLKPKEEEEGPNKKREKTEKNEEETGRCHTCC